MPLSSDHVDVATLERYALGELSPPEARRVNEHIQVCDDARCADFVRSLTADEPTRQRTFHARESAWAALETMAQELDRPIDELLNEAMIAYARVRGYTGSAARQRPTVPVPSQRPSFVAPRHDALEETRDAPLPPVRPPVRSRAPSRPGDEDDLVLTGGRPSLGPPEVPAYTYGEATDNRTVPRARPPVSAPPGGPQIRKRAPTRPPPLPPRSSQPVPASSTPAFGAEAAKQLFITYRGQLYPVDKDRFLIGRSKTQADLRLDDPNVSRQHAVIERVGSAWYIVDLGSTNGIQVAGERVARRAISDRDLIVITHHELYCSFR